MVDPTPPSSSPLSGYPPHGPASDGADPELSALPVPRRPWRKATLGTLGLSGLASLLLMVGLRVPVAYSLVSGQPVDVGALGHFQPEPAQANTWVHGSGVLDAAAVTYKRPLDPDRFRLAPLVNNPKIWVELREPGDTDSAYFIAPESFVGRLTPVSDPGLFHTDLIAALKDSGQGAPPQDAWLLIDGDSPGSGRWVLGVAAMLVGFAAFSIFGLYRLAAPLR